MLGFKIEPSAIRTGAGKAMWDKWEKAGDAKHLSKGVAEGSLNEFDPGDYKPPYKSPPQDPNSIGAKLRAKLDTQA
jgi:hypothetical protein